MPCAAYTDPRLAAVYDTLNPPGRDNAFYTALAAPAPRRILDMGCGTGRLAVDLAALGHEVTGADPAGAMLEIARRRPGGERVTWVESTAAALDLTSRFDQIIMTGHVFQVFLDDATARDSLAALRRHLAPSGRVTFETRNPAVREWESWTPALTRELVQVPSVGAVMVHYEVTAVVGELVTYLTHFAFGPGDNAVAESRLRFMPQATLARLLNEAGYGAVTWYGDWDKSPVGPHSPELIVLAHC